MEQNDLSTDKSDKKNQDREAEADYPQMFRKFVLIVLASSVVPLFLVGWGINIHYTIFNKSSMLTSFQESIAQHQKTIELFLNNQSSNIQFIAQTNILEHLSDKKYLAKTFKAMRNNGVTH